MKVLFLLIALALPCLAQSVPRYKDYPAEAFSGVRVAPKIATERAKQFRAQIIEGAQKPPNFAGHFRIIGWGCGSSCVQFAIVDIQSGAVYMPDFYVAHGSALTQEKLREDEPLQFKANSKLLVVVGSRNEKGEGCYFYKWNGSKLVLIKTIMQTK